ncbi:nuclear transport factor 2 family protein [Chryseobacterium suipulveris]|uniref:Nuclear transport factor 2 family protein n=1 Tax=Chryseobacterium suipulveris TaxID=2929800 RepID=A0ABY4BSZ4_9FLAO|nr:nuclear transport factor 2 family protein [Chryseobacterium suipulveris]UOE42321.1 nuclear transport factor 2 family protein [Chryseobacterium suipulveris]
MDNKQIAKQFIDNLFVDNDKAYEVVAEDVRVNWPGFGMEDIVGKQNLRNFLDNGGPDKVISQKINNLICENNTVIGDGTIVTERNGKKETSHFADVYTIENGKITHLNSYMVMDKNNESQP